MRHRVPITLLALLAALAALALPSIAGAAQVTTRGIVVQRDVRSGSVVLASPSGVLHRLTIANPGKLTMGAVIKVRGTKISVLGRSGSAKVRGVVMRRSRHTYALAGNGAVLAVTTPTPPPAGQQVTATVQVTGTTLSDDDGEVEVGDTHAPSAEIHGTVLSQDATTLRVSVAGFPAGLPIALAGQVIPALPVGSRIEARVTLGPDPANPAGVVLTLVSLHAENGNGGGHGHHGSDVKAEGKVAAVVDAGPVGGAPGSITILDEHGSVTFVIPAGFGPTGAVIGDHVEARGTAATVAGGNPTLVRLEGAGDQQGDDEDDQEGDSGDHRGDSGATGTGQIGAGAPVSSGGSGDRSGSND
jgi:hypothetical protein